MAYISFLISHVPPAHSFFQKKSILINPTQNLEAVLNCLFEDFSPQRTFQTIQNSFLVQLVFLRLHNHFTAYRKAAFQRTPEKENEGDLPAVLVPCARDESRTHTSQLTLAPETSASTISPPALEVDCKYTEYLRNRKQNQARIHNLVT